MYSQHPYRCRLDWGWHGTLEATRRGDILVSVDMLRFSSAEEYAKRIEGEVEK